MRSYISIAIKKAIILIIIPNKKIYIGFGNFYINN